MSKPVNDELIKELSDQFIEDDKQASKIKTGKRYSANVGIGMKLLYATKGTKLNKFLHRQHLTTRLPKWLINKVMIAAKEEGITNYIEELIIKELKLKITKKTIINIINET